MEDNEEREESLRGNLLPIMVKHSQSYLKTKTNSEFQCNEVPSSTNEQSYFNVLPPEYRDGRFVEAYNVLGRYVDCTEDTLYRRLGHAEELGKVASMSFVFLKCAVVSTFQNRPKVLDLQARAASAFRKDPVTFTEMVKRRTFMHEAFHPGPIAEQVPLMLEDRPQAAKLEYLVYIACLYFLDPVISMQSLGVCRERLDQLVKYCINIDIDKLEAELAYSVSGIS